MLLHPKSYLNCEVREDLKVFSVLCVSTVKFPVGGNLGYLLLEGRLMPIIKLDFSTKIN